MDLKPLRSKIVGSEEERAVSPVIGVILMVAITVILAAVIAAFVLDLGDSVGQEAQAGVTIEVDENDEVIQVEITSIGNSDHVNLSGSVTNADWYDGVSENDFYDTGNPGDEMTELGVGDVVTLGDGEDVNMDDVNSPSGTVTAIAVIEGDDTETQVASEEFDFSFNTA